MDKISFGFRNFYEILGQVFRKVLIGLREKMELECMDQFNQIMAQEDQGKKIEQKQEQ